MANTDTGQGSAAETTTTAPRVAPVVRLLAKLFLAGVVVQFLLAGLGTFDVAHGGAYKDSYFTAHGVCAVALTVLTAVMLVVTLVTRSGLPVAGQSLALGVLTTPVQHALATAGSDSAPWVGALHVLVGLAILGLAARIAYPGLGAALRGAAKEGGT
jgi:hypothetical protein